MSTSIPDLREAQGRGLWNCGFGLGLGLGRDPNVKAKNFKEYLEWIPRIPEGLLEDDSWLSLLSLCDPLPGLTPESASSWTFSTGI